MRFPPTCRFVLLAAVASAGCSPSATAPQHPVELLPNQQYRFACHQWTPTAPPVTRTVVDLRLAQIDTASAPSAQLVEAIEAAGGRIRYRFHGPMVRVELDVAAVHSLAALSSAVTVANTDSHDVSMVVMLDHDLDSSDLQAVAALGARITHEFHALDGYSVVIDDARVPELRALPGVRLAGFDAFACLA